MSKMVRLSDVADLTVGFVGTMAEHYVDNGVPFLRSLNVKPFSIVSDDLKYISKEFSESIAKSILHEGDIIIVRTGIPGTCAVVPAEYDGCNCSDVVIVHPNREVVDENYLAAYINIWGQRQVQNNKVGAIQKHFNISAAMEMLVYLPSIEVQKKYAQIILALNKKINNNLLLCTELESMAKTIYDYWFLQFDFPDENGNPYRQSGGKMVWNEELKREIPEGWNVGNLYNIADFVNGLACQKFRPQNNEMSLPVVKIKEMHDGITVDTEKVSACIPEKYKITDGDVLFSWSATLEVMIWFGGVAGLNQHIFNVKPINGYSREYVYYQLSAYVINFVKIADSRKTTMGHITSDHLKQSRIALPPCPITDSFSKVIAPIIDKIGQCQKEIHECVSLRDFLLPMLINGQVRMV